MENEVRKNRKLLKYDWDFWNEENPKNSQEQPLPFPTFEKEYPNDAPLIDLILPENFTIGKIPLIDVMNSRISRRRYSDEPLSLEELSFLLWCTQGVKHLMYSDKEKKIIFGVKRVVPSSGARSPFETYLFINRVENLTPGLYRYIAFEHKLLFLKSIKNQPNVIADIVYQQQWVGSAAVIFCWIAVPYRTEEKYMFNAHKFIAFDVGIVSQSLYLAAEGLNLGTCAIGHYQQKKMDELFELDSEDELSLLVQPVGKIAQKFRLKDFFDHKQSPVTEEDLRKIAQTYLLGEWTIDVQYKEGKLVVEVGGEQYTLRPRNPTEFLSQGYVRAAKVILKVDGTVEKMKVLLDDDTIYEISPKTKPQ